MDLLGGTRPAAAGAPVPDPLRDGRAEAPQRNRRTGPRAPSFDGPSHSFRGLPTGGQRPPNRPTPRGPADRGSPRTQPRPTPSQLSRYLLEPASTPPLVTLGPKENTRTSIRGAKPAPRGTQGKPKGEAEPFSRKGTTEKAEPRTRRGKPDLETWRATSAGTDASMQHAGNGRVALFLISSFCESRN